MENLSAGNPKRWTKTLFRAAMVVDAENVCSTPGVVLVENDRVIAAGAAEAVGVPEDAGVVECRQEVIIPALVNAHAHLDLSHVGPVPFDGDFIAWLESVRRLRCTTDADVEASVRRGVALCRAGGTALVGDIAASTASVSALRAAALGGVAYLELFGLGRRQADRALELARQLGRLEAMAGGVRLGLQPHAPYSCGPALYRAAARTGRPIATHLAELPEEIEFVVSGTGPLRSFLERLGLWDPTIDVPGVHPVEAVLNATGGAPLLAAHVNYLEPEHLDLLVASGVAVAYCPRASVYFGHPKDGRPPHAYRAMLDAGITVALGTDSVLCVDTPDRLSVLDEMRLLHERDGTDPRGLLAMGTTAGARALGLDPALVTLDPGPTAGLLAIPIDPGAGAPLEQVMRGGALRWLT